MLLEMRFDSFDGTPIAYEDQGEGPPVVCAHGFAADAYINWIRSGVEEALTGSGFRVITYDARGHGGSGKPHDPGAYADGAMLKDLRALVEHLGLEEFDLMGYSMGGRVALGLLCTDPAGVRRAVLGGIGGRMLQERDAAAREALADGLLTPDKGTIENPTAKAFRDFADLTGADKEALAAIQRAPLGPPENLEGIDVPVLVITGDDDPLVGSPDDIAERIDGARAKVVGGTHLNVVNNPEFHREVTEFLTEE